MNDIHSLPDSLREQIQQAAASIVPRSDVKILPPGDPIQQIVTEIARQSPELFAALIIANTGFSGIETVETEETTEERVVETYTRASGREWKVQPIKTQRTVRRQVLFLRDGATVKGLRERS